MNGAKWMGMAGTVDDNTGGFQGESECVSGDGCRQALFECQQRKYVRKKERKIWKESRGGKSDSFLGWGRVDSERAGGGTQPQLKSGIACCPAPRDAFCPSSPDSHILSGLDVFYALVFFSFFF